MEVTQCRIGQNVLVHELLRSHFIASISSIEQTVVRVTLRGQIHTAPIKFITLALRPLHSLTLSEGKELFKIAFDSEEVEDLEIIRRTPYTLIIKGYDCFSSECIKKTLELKSDSCYSYYSDDGDREACPFNARAAYRYLDNLGIDSEGLIEAKLAVDITQFNTKP